MAKKKKSGRKSKPVQSAGTHLIIDFWKARNLNSVSFCKKALEKAVKDCDVTLLKISLHKFSPQGVSGVAVISESHISVHTWPEHEYVALDVFLCGEKDPYLALESLQKSFKPKIMNVTEMKRGIFI